MLSSQIWGGQLGREGRSQLGGVGKGAFGIRKAPIMDQSLASLLLKHSLSVPPQGPESLVGGQEVKLASPTALGKVPCPQEEEEDGRAAPGQRVAG